MQIKKTLLKVVMVVLAVAVLFSTVPMVSLNADAAVYGEFFELEELKESIMSEGTQAVPVITGVDIEDKEVGVYDKVEITFDIDATWENPYDPDEIKVDGVFTYPSGKEVTIPGFFMTPMVYVYPSKLNMSYSPDVVKYDPEYNGESTWCLRFSGDEEGDYSFYITVTDKDGNSSKSTSYEFSCYEAGNKGYAMVSEDNPEYVVNSADGSVYYGSGVNIPWVRSQFTLNPLHMSYNYFVGKAKGTSNMTRIWICHYNWLEWMPDEGSSSTWGFVGGLGYYNQIMGCSFDNILELCEDAGLRIILTLEDNDEHYADGSYANWKWNPYNVENGGPAADTRDYFRNDAVREQYKKRLRYMIARWGYSSALFSFNMWNDQQSFSDPEVVEYHKVLRDYSHSLTDGWRPLLYGSNFNYGVNDVIDYTVQMINMNDGTKPYITQECYADANDLRNTLRNTIWSEFVQGAAATLYWSQDEVDLCNDGEGCWDVFDNILDFSADIPLDKSGKFTSSLIKDVEATATNPNADFQTITQIRSYGDVAGYGQKATENQFTVDTSVAGMNLTGYISRVYGSNHTNTWKNPPTFTIDVPNGGMVLFEATESSHSTVSISVDGVEKARHSYVDPATGTGGRFLVTDDYEGKFQRVELTPGTHKVLIDNVGSDWLSFRLFFIANSESPASMLTVDSMVSDSAAVVYVNNTTYSMTAAQLLGNEATDFTDVKFTVEGLKEDGAYAMYQFDPDTGEYGTISEVTVSGGKIDISIPSVKKDAAIKLIKLEDGETIGEGSRYEYLQLVSTSTINSGNAGNTDDDTDDDKKDGGNATTIIIIVVVVVVVLAAAAVAFVLISKKKKDAAKSAEDKPEDKE